MWLELYSWFALVDVDFHTAPLLARYIPDEHSIPAHYKRQQIHIYRNKRALK